MNRYVLLPLSCFKIRSVLSMKPEGMSTRELVGKCFLTKKIETQAGTARFLRMLF